MPRCLTRFSLRALLFVVTLLCCLLGYHIEWIRQRHAFIAEQTKKSEGDVSTYLLELWEPSALSNNLGVKRLGYNRAPFGLRIFGERGYHSILIAIPPTDASPDRAVNRWGVLVGNYSMTDAQSDYARAMRLFPEATVWPYTYVNGTVQEVYVRDARTGEIKVWNYRQEKPK